jgi:hypothetical protein
VRVPLSRLLLKDNIPAGMNFMLLGAFAIRYRSSSEDLDPALIREAGDGLYRILDGRHRFVASLIAGRPDLLCALEVLDHQETP